MFSLILLQASESAGGGMAQILFFGSIFLIMYFFFLRPQVKKQKAQDKFSSDLQKGDEVVTSSGIIGKINKIENGVVHLQVAEKTFIRLVSGAISREMTEALNKKEESK